MLILSILVLLIILAPLAVGSVYIVTYSAAECIIFTLLLIHILTFRSSAAHPPPSSGLSSSVSDHTPRPSGPGLFVLLLPFLFFLIFVLFQMVPIPVALIRSVSPNTYGLYEKLGLLSDNLPLSLSLYGTSVAFLKWAAFGALFFVIATHRPTVPVLEGHRWIAILAVSIIFIGFVEALYGLYTYVNDPGALLWFTRTYGAHSGRVAGTYVNPNHLAGLMNMTLPLAVAFLVFFAGSAGNGKRRVKDVIIDLATSRKALVSYLLFFGIVLMVLALIFSGSRMGQFGFCAGFVAIAVLSLLRLAQKGRKRFPLPVLLIVVSCMSAGLLWGAWKGLDPVIERWEVAGQALAKGRSILWETTKPLISDFPAAGTGLGTYELAYRRYQPESFGAALYDHAHNDYLEVLAETGWIGFVLWLGFFILFLVRVIIKWFRNPAPFSVAMGAGGIAATIAILVHSLGEFNLQIPANGLLLFATMGITWRSV